MSGRRISDKTKVKRKCGTGTGKNYIPWFKASEVSSAGRKCRVVGLITNRQHLLLSTLEQDYFYYLDNTDGIITDIREQKDLDIKITQDICREFGIKHIYGRDGKPTRYTTDFLITKSDGKLVARTCKYGEDLNEKEKSIKEKFTIEREYYKRLGIDWKIVREIDFDRKKAENYGSCYKMRVLSRYDVRFRDFNTYKAYIYKLLDMLLSNPDFTLQEIISRYENVVGLEGNGLNVLRHMIINKIIYIDMHEFINNHKPIVIERYRNDLDKFLKDKWDWNSQLPKAR